MGTSLENFYVQKFYKNNKQKQKINQKIYLDLIDEIRW